MSRSTTTAASLTCADCGAEIDPWLFIREQARHAERCAERLAAAERWIPGQPTRIYYDARVQEHWAHPGDAEKATVVGSKGGAMAGSLAYVAEIIAAVPDGEPLGPWIVEAALMRAREIRERLHAGFGPLGFAVELLRAHCDRRPSIEAREAYGALRALAELWAGG